MQGRDIFAAEHVNTLGAEFRYYKSVDPAPIVVKGANAFLGSMLDEITLAEIGNCLGLGFCEFRRLIDPPDRICFELRREASRLVGGNGGIFSESFCALLRGAP